MRRGVALVVLTLAACQSVANPTPVQAPGAVPSSDSPVVAELPASCVAFLSELECWLRASGNQPSAADQAVGAARAVFETLPSGAQADDRPAMCGRAQHARMSVFRAAGCDAATADRSSLPPADHVSCPAQQHFFVRRDGRVIGCRADCTSASDCPHGQTCTSIGSAAGGPIDEPFCDDE